MVKDSKVQALKAKLDEVSFGIARWALGPSEGGGRNKKQLFIGEGSRWRLSFNWAWKGMGSTKRVFGRVKGIN